MLEVREDRFAGADIGPGGFGIQDGFRFLERGVGAVGRLFPGASCPDLVLFCLVTSLFLFFRPFMVSYLGAKTQYWPQSPLAMLFS